MDMPIYKIAATLALLAGAGDAVAQTSNCMDMGGGMTHCDNMGSNGSTSSTNCTNMGGGMATCNTMDMSQPQRTYPTPDMSRPQSNGTTLSFIGDLIARSRDRSFQKKLNERLSSGDCNGAATFALLNGRDVLSDQIHHYCMEKARALPAVGSPVSQASALLSAPLTPSPMSFVSASPMSFDGIDIFIGTPLMGEPNYTTSYTVKFLGRKFTTFGPNGVSTPALFSAFDQGLKENPWIYYTTDSVGEKYSWNINSLKIYNSGYEVWILKYDNGYVNGKWVRNEKPLNKPKQTKILQFVNCEAQTIQTFETVIYDDTGAVKSSYKGSGTASRIVPETVGSALYDEMCKIVP